MIDARTEASQQLAKAAGIGAAALAAAKWLAPKVLQHAPRFLGKTVGGWLGRAAPNVIGKAVTHGLYGTAIGGGLGALTAKPGERIKGLLGGVATGGLAGLGAGAVAGGLSHALAPWVYGGGANVMARGMKAPLNFKPGEITARMAQGMAAMPYTRAGMMAKPVGLGRRALSWLPFAPAMLGGGGGGESAAPGAIQGAVQGSTPRVAANAASDITPDRLVALLAKLRASTRAPGLAGTPWQQPAFTRYMGRGNWPKAGELMDIFVKGAEALPQFNTVPLTAHTAVADYIKNKKYKPPAANEFTRDDQALLNRLVAGMSGSSARAVGEHRRARNEPQRLLA